MQSHFPLDTNIFQGYTQSHRSFTKWKSECSIVPFRLTCLGKLHNLAKNGLTNNFKFDKKYIVTNLKIRINLKVCSYPKLKGS